MNEVALKDDIKLSVADVKKYIAPNATDKELFMFMGISKSFGLNPFKREVHFIKYGQQAASIVVGYEQYIKRAERSGKLDGWKCWIERDDIGEKAIIEIKRKDQSIPIRWEVYRKEFDKGQSTWKSMPTFMLKKVAIAQGFRLAFSEDVGGMPYIPEEMPDNKGGGVTEALPVEDVNTDAPPTTPERYLEEPPLKMLIDERQISQIMDFIDRKGIDQSKFLKYMACESIETIPAEAFNKAIASLQAAKGKQ